jgi:hypothetical protein
VTRSAALALAAGQVVDECNAPAAAVRDDLVPQHSAGRCCPDLLDIRSAKAAGEHADELSRAVGLGHVRKRRLSVFVEDDRAHGSIVGRWRSSSIGAPTCG